MKPPNILLIVSDQQHPDLLGAAGRYPVRTPALDRLCAEGIRFTRGYTPCPLCTPARATLVTGQYPSRHGAWSIGTSLAENCLSLPAMLSARAGYRTAIIGKSHLQSCLTPGSFEALPRSRDWDFFSRWSGPWYGFDEARVCVGHGPEPHAYGMHYGHWLRTQGIPPEPPYFDEPGPDGGTVGMDDAWALPEHLHTSAWVADETIGFLRRMRDSGETRPFFASVNFPDPHPPFLAAEPWNDLYDGMELPPPVRRSNEVQGKPTLYRTTLEGSYPTAWSDGLRLPCQIARNTSELEHTADEKRAIRRCMAMQSLLDKHLARILDSLDELDFSRDTLIVYTSDHGDYLGNHWLWSKGGSHYDDAVRVPFVVRWPGIVPEGGVSSALQSLVDLPTTFLNAAGLPPDPAMQGVDQTPSWTDPDQHTRTGVRIEHRVERGIDVESWITERHRISLHNIVAEQRTEMELYDLESDPDEFENIADSAPDLALKLIQEMCCDRATADTPTAPRTAFA